MKIIKQARNLDRYNYYKMHLELYNVLLPVRLSEKELEVIASFMSLTNDKVAGDYFNSTARAEVMSKLGMKPGGLSNHIKSLIKKGFLTKHEITKRITIKDFLFPDELAQGFQIKLKIKQDE